MNFYEMWNLVERYGGAQRVVMYHGTSDKFLDSILQQGLVPNPAHKSWDANDPSMPATADVPSAESLGGVYLAKSLRTACDAAEHAVQRFGGNMLFVICQIQPRSLAADEDAIVTAMLVLPTEPNSAFHIWSLYASVVQQRNIDQKVNAFADNAVIYIKSHTKTPIHPSFEQRIRQLFVQAFPAAVKRKVAYLDDDQRPPIFQHIPIPNRQEAEHEFRQHLEQLTRTLKRFANTHSSDTLDYRTTGRSLQPIAFHGTNKILAIARITQSPRGADWAQKLYGTYPQTFRDAWKKFSSERLP